MTSIAPSAPTESVHVDPADALQSTVPARWLLLLGVPFVVGGALFGAGLAMDKMWMLGFAALFGPGAIILGFTYLGLTSDTNRID
jgi:hypothetical protein